MTRLLLAQNSLKFVASLRQQGDKKQDLELKQGSSIIPLGYFGSGVAAAAIQVVQARPSKLRVSKSSAKTQELTLAIPIALELRRGRDLLAISTLRPGSKKAFSNNLRALHHENG